MNTKLVCIPLAAALLGACLSASAMEATSERFPPAQNLSYNHAPGPDMPVDGSTAPLGGNQYLFLAGSAFNPRTSSQLVTYPGAGCSYSDNNVTTSLELPDGVEILGVRLYYYNNGSPGSVGLFLTAYTGDGGVADLVTGSSLAATGYASDYFVPGSPLFIDNFGQSYALIANMNANQRFCGMRVFYAQ